MRNLSPIQMLQAIQHAELRLGYKFSKEDFSEGRVGGMMAPEDFNFEENVSTKQLTLIVLAVISTIYRQEAKSIRSNSLNTSTLFSV